MAGVHKKLLTLSVYFEKLLNNIEPPEHRLAVAAEIPADVRQFLQDS